MDNIIYINENKTSYVKIIPIEEPFGFSMNEFEELWKCKPIEKLKIQGYGPLSGKIISCPRYSISYLKNYNFSKIDHEAELNIPPRIEKLLEDSQKINPDLNQCLTNWYENDGSIGFHSDDIRQLKPNSEIWSFSFGPAIREFNLEPKIKGDSLNISLKHNTLVIMGGECQKTHKHAVLQQSKNKNNLNGRRLNITFRCFK